ncbi:MAG TPA: MOSC domain-containing protein [Thermoanaerobaculia bacterium]|nr:MOSC domain-containing protein [Thermoanaerobaculia bacterium]
MRIVSVNVGLPRPALWHGREVMTGIFKEPVAGRVAVHTLNLDGDRQADLTVHGGVHKAVYAYPSEHYPFWEEELEKERLPWATFGENLTTEGWLEEEVFLGDRFRAGTAELTVTQPRMPCFKLALKLGRTDVLETFLESGRSGFYFAVTREGEVGAGDAFERIHEDENRVSIADTVRLYLDRDGRSDPDLLRRVVRVDALPESWREHFEQQAARRA